MDTTFFPTSFALEYTYTRIFHLFLVAFTSKSEDIHPRSERQLLACHVLLAMHVDPVIYPSAAL
jgi:hypothetical protein